ncbi:uncharacterized protein METZ01_LOCUS66929 [marine metagenome]|uniref:Uncharacterized protein n=1 Tax=marine metagenome TaxID=408172 RepID=A0A381TD49_9ZZZZ
MGFLTEPIFKLRISQKILGLPRRAASKIYFSVPIPLKGCEIFKPNGVEVSTVLTAQSILKHTAISQNIPVNSRYKINISQITLIVM